MHNLLLDVSIFFRKLNIYWYTYRERETERYRCFSVTLISDFYPHMVSDAMD